MDKWIFISLWSKCSNKADFNRVITLDNLICTDCQNFLFRNWHLNCLSWITPSTLWVGVASMPMFKLRITYIFKKNCPIFVWVMSSAFWEYIQFDKSSTWWYLSSELNESSLGPIYFTAEDHSRVFEIVPLRMVWLHLSFWKKIKLYK